MDCADCLDRLYQYLDRELSPEETATVKAHLDACGGCTDHFYFEKRFLAKVHDAHADDRAPPERLRQAIILRLRHG